MRPRIYVVSKESIIFTLSSATKLSLKKSWQFRFILTFFFSKALLLFLEASLCILRLPLPAYAYLRFSRSLFSLPFPSFVQQRTVESAVGRCRQVLAGLRSFAKGGGGASAKVTKTSRALSSWETVPDTVVGAHSNGLPAPHKVPEGCLWNPLSLRPASKTTCAARSAQITETWNNNYAPPLGP